MVLPDAGSDVVIVKRTRSNTQSTTQSKTRPFYLEWWFILGVSIISIGVFVVAINILQRDVGGNEMKGSESHVYISNMDPNNRMSADDAKRLNEEYSRRVPVRKRNNARILWESDYRFAVSTGGDTSTMVEHYSSLTGARLSSDTRVNVHNASMYFSAISGDVQYYTEVGRGVVDTDAGMDRLEMVLDRRDAERDAMLREVHDLETSIKSFSPRSFEDGTSGVIQIDKGDFVKFNAGDKRLELVSNKGEATPVGVVNNRLVMGGDDDGLCYPFHESSDSYDRADGISNPVVKGGQLKRHPCINDDGSRYDVVMDGNKISKLGGSCFGFSGIESGAEFQLSETMCERGVAEARIVNPDDISSSAENSGLGLEKAPDE
jgi:hypothetical protein